MEFPVLQHFMLAEEVEAHGLQFHNLLLLVVPVVVVMVLHHQAELVQTV
jgi:hypothetical protein